MTTTAKLPSVCPKCASALDCATSVFTRAEPKPGDFTVCLYCVSVLRFEKGFALRETTPGELALLPLDMQEQIARVQAAAPAETGGLMRTKCFEVRDSATFIPVVAISTRPANEAQRYLLRRTGYSPDGATVIVVKLSDAKASNDPYAWGDARTMPVAHEYIERNFDELADGAVVDVEFILGETKEPKLSEREEMGG